MTRLGRTWGLAAAVLACAGAIGVGGCGTAEPDDPPGSTSGDVEPIGELAGPTVPLEDDGFSTILSLTLETGGEGRTLIAGQLKLARTGHAAEVRILIDGEEERSAEAREVDGGGSLVIACGCELEAGEHEVELQGQASSGTAPVAARSLVALDGVEYATEPQDGTGPLPPALNAAAFETSPVLVSGAPTTLADLSLAGTASGDRTLIVAQIGSTRATLNPAGIALLAGIGGQEADRLASLTSASTKVDAFTIAEPPSPGESVQLLGNIVGGGSTELNLVSLIVCPCGLETES